MSSPFAEQILTSFDGSENRVSKVFSPDRYRALERIFSKPGSFSVQGAGLSYAALSFGGGTSQMSSVIQMSQWNRFLNFDSQAGLIEVEAGMSLGELANFSVPRGWYLKVQPGHPSISVGGCLGADIHGKNQFQDGNFKDQVTFLRVFHPRKGYLFCDRETNTELFDLTCGGWGLTGVVLSVGLRLGPLLSDEIETETIPLEDIRDLPQVLKERSQKDDLLYSWHDFNRKKNWGRGFVVAGRNRANQAAPGAGNDIQLQNRNLRSEKRGFGNFNMMNSFVVQVMNTLYSKKELSGRGPQTQELLEFLFPVLEKTIYFDLFGKKGFHETQVLIPTEQFPDLVRELEKARFQFDLPITLASTKLFRGKPDLLRFLGEGVVLALNFPRSQESLRFLAWWDSLICELRCQPNLSKDSRLPLEIVQRCYPPYDIFKTRLQNWDPERLFQTSLSGRLNL